MLWRISSHCDLRGMGGEPSDGRWHTAAIGKRVVYLAEHPALALVETLVNMRANAGRFPSAFQLLKVAAPEQAAIETVSQVDLGEGWESALPTTQLIGDAWLAGSKSALLRVPSAPSPESWNYLLNPLHPDARQLQIEWCRWIAYDSKLFGFRERG